MGVAGKQRWPSADHCGCVGGDSFYYFLHFLFICIVCSKNFKTIIETEKQKLSFVSFLFIRIRL